ncbi:MAG: hypothetical protein AB7G39_15125 [Alphaproteobacteria bacterium]
MNIARRIGPLVMAATLSACLGGETLPPTQVGDGPVQLNLSPVTDIPIPQGVSYDSERSLILSEKDRWTGRLVMSSSLTPVKSFAFYKEQMPGFQWTPVMSVQSRTSVLTFTRDNRAATVQIEGTTFGGSDIVITIAPRNENSGLGGGMMGAAPLGQVSSQPAPPLRGGMYPAAGPNSGR